MHKIHQRPLSMKTNNNVSYLKRQEKSYQSDRYLVRKTLKQIQRLEAKEQKILSLGQYALAYLNLIIETTKKLGKCFYKQHTMADMLGCHRSTIQIKESKLKEMGIVSIKSIKKIGAKDVQIRTINDPTILKGFLKLLAMSIASIIMLFSCNATRIFIDINLYKKSSQSAPQLRVADGGVPPGATKNDISSTNKLPKAEVDAIFGSIFTIPAIQPQSNIQQPACCLLSQGLKMNEELIPQYILNLKSVHLTKAGQAAVSAFRPEILASADSKLLRYKGSLRSRIGYFLKLCHELSREKNLLPDYNYAAYLHQQLGTDDTMPLSVDNRKPIISPKREQAALSEQVESAIAPAGLFSEAIQAKEETPPSLPSLLRPNGFVGQAYVLLNEAETEQRRAAFMNDPEVIAGIDKLATLMGHEHASKYFARVFDNLKIKEL